MLWSLVVWTAVLGQWLACCHQLTPEDQDSIVEMHILFRSQVIPSATNMQSMSWDDALAGVAAGYVTRCVWDHNPDLIDTGENLFASNGPFNASKAVNSWYLEHLDYSYHSNTCEEDKLCGHYTQVVWAETHLIGCASHLCEVVEGLSFGGVTMLVCNYSPQGNFIGEKPYEEGEPCTNCPEGLQHCEKNICVSEPSAAPEEPELPELTTERPLLGTDSPPPPTDDFTTESPAMETDGSVTMETDASVTMETDGSVPMETDGSVPMGTDGRITTSDSELPLGATFSPPPPIPPILMEDRETESDRGVTAASSAALLCATLLLLLTL